MNNTAKKELVHAINNYDDESIESFIQLRNILCKISDRKKREENDEFLNELLYVAAQKLRIFGYNDMNGFDDEYIQNFYLSEFQLLKDDFIKATYTSESGTLLDYKQRKVINTYDELESKKIIVSAPTSFGKTRLLREIIFKYRYETIVLIFPTNALLFENFDELDKFNIEHNLGYQIINSTNSNEKTSSKTIYVLTPERYLKLRNEIPSLKIDFFFMDEIYKIDNSFIDKSDGIEENNRDKIFRIVLYILSKEVESFYLAGPYVNLQKMGDGLQEFINRYEVKLVQIDEELVVKNIIKCWDANISINEIPVRYYAEKKKTTIELVKTILSKDAGSTLIYCSSKDEIDRLAIQIKEISNYSDRQVSNELRNFINHLDNRYSYLDGSLKVDWSIKSYLENNIAVHYGSLPKYIQNEMINLFNKGNVDLILSTTSITEGVNTNAKNLIFYGNKKGRKSLKVFDVKNIIGRAGRYYHHFVGNIYIFDKEIEEKNNLASTEKLDFITFTDKPISVEDIDNTDVNDLIGRNKQLKESRQTKIEQSSIPNSVFEKNRAIDWIKQIELFNGLNSKSKNELLKYKEKYESLHIFISKDNNSLEFIFYDLLEAGIIESFEAKIYPAIAKTFSYLGFRGLISYEIKSKKETSNKKELDFKEYSTCFRNALKKMNEIVEYKVPKYLNLHFAIFVYVCKLKEIEINETCIEKIINYYETGVFTKIGTYLINKGYPNITVKELETKNSVEMELEIDEFKSRLLTGNLVLIKQLDEFERDFLLRIFNK
ncbi:MAG: DEAD/DEAH box helicase [Erysipelotrichales bacterium]|nr:DEAD/DEAH box helicase [Erysipelotrichales bacterium]